MAELAYFDLDGEQMEIVDEKARKDFEGQLSAEILATFGTTLHGSKAGGLRVERILGASEQETTTGKNLLQNMGTSETKNGVTFTVNDDGSVTVNGTATDTTRFMINSYGLGLSLSVGETYVLSGCPSGGGHSSYRLQFYNFDESSSFAYDLGDGKEFVYTNSGNDYNVVISVGSGVTVSNIVFKPMLRLASITDSTYEPYTNGASPNPEYPQPIVSVGQIKTTGAQLIEDRLESGTHNGITITHNSDGTYTFNGTATQTANFRVDQSVFGGSDNLKSYDGTYTLSLEGNKRTDVHAFVIQDGTWTQPLVVSNSPNTATFTLDKCFICVGVDAGVTVDNYVVKPMLNKGSTALPWEPYTGGKKASFDVGIDVVVHGAQLAESVYARTALDMYTNVLYIECDLQPSTTYTLSLEGTVGNRYYFNEFITASVYFNVVDGINVFTFTTNETFDKTNGSYYESGRGWRILKNGKEGNADHNFRNVMLNYGTEALPYAPYETQTTHIDRVLYGIGDVKDELTSEGIVRRFAKVVYDGSADEDWQINATNTDGVYRVLTTYSIGMVKPVANNVLANILCTHHVANTANTSGTWGCHNGIAVNSGGGTYIYDENFNTSDISLWKAHLAENPIIVIYELETPTTESLSTEEQLALLGLKTYNGATNVSVDSGDVAADFSVRYGTSEVGALSLENSNLVAVNELLLAEMQAAVPYRVVIDDEAGTINFIDR